MKKILLFLLLSSCFLTAQVITVNHKYYDMVYETTSKTAVYTHYFLTAEMLTEKFLKTDFKPDPVVSVRFQGCAKDYKNSYYDKGHLCPNLDFRFDETAQKESMYYTNCAPQNPKLNRGLWKTLENYVRTLAKKGKVEVWTGTLYQNSKEMVGNLRLPSHFWKIIKCEGIYKGYKIPNVTPKDKDLKKYEVDPEEILKMI